MNRRRRIAQLRAISYAYTAMYRRDAIHTLADMGVDFYAYCKRFNYNGSPCKLLTDFNRGAKRTVSNVNQFREEANV